MTLLVAFVISLPAFIFYATGYRYDFFSESPALTATGGLYIFADANERTIFLNESEVKSARIFRRAAYIQGLEPGLHRVHVQAPGLDTWVKEIWVMPQRVTEIEAFNMPLKPQVRLITPFETSAGQAVLAPNEAQKPVLRALATTTQLFFATSTATSTWRVNPEYVELNDLFAAQASTTRLRREYENVTRFSFATSASSTSIAELGTTTVRIGQVELYQAGEDVYLKHYGVGRSIPYYFCANTYELPSSDLVAEEVIAPQEWLPATGDSCRESLKIDRQGEEVLGFDFLPSNTNLVLLLLNSGLYVVEADDRGWQNSQLLYGGKDLAFLVYRGGIYLKEEGMIFEIFTEISNL